MNSMKYLGLVLGLSLFVAGCGGDDNGSSGSIDPKDCDAVGARYKSLSNSAGCADTSAMLTSNCKSLYAAKLCTSQFEGLVSCVAVKPASDFTCDADDELELKTDACKAQQTALDTCLGP